ncbi:Crp/Fnr family transcriptional regulator [Desulfovibrio inopinatus]|uniref:Crp/Fnr family transcriptional regulator n=1 Tax=Desulfovibrio inopinatus TaxID=102109 RepID=UPI0004266B60|nr:Crp/Fnr family transcriptional regulator [Desulfovibrio inopinatus]
MDARKIRHLFSAHAIQIEGRKTDILISKGDKVSGVFLVTEGRLRVFAMNSEGKQATLYRLKPQELCLLSLNSTFTGGNYPAWVYVESDVATVLAMPGETFRKLFAEEPDVQEVLLSSLTTSISSLLLQLDELLLSSLGERVLSFLKNNWDSEGKITLTHQELADHLGATREAISRELAILRNQGIIDCGRGVVRLCGHAELQP